MKKKRGHYKTYTVYDNRTDFPVVVDGDIYECCKAMGVSVKSFHSIVSRACSGERKKWSIVKHSATDHLTKLFNTHYKSKHNL